MPRLARLDRRDRGRDRRAQPRRDRGSWPGARARGSLRHAYHGNVEQKNFALDQLKTDWVVALDADEALSPELSARLRERLAGDPEGLDGIELNRVTRHLGRWIRHGDFHPDWQLRVFRRSRGRWAGQQSAWKGARRRPRGEAGGRSRARQLPESRRSGGARAGIQPGGGGGASPARAPRADLGPVSAPAGPVPARLSAQGRIPRRHARLRDRRGHGFPRASQVRQAVGAGAAPRAAICGEAP